MSFLGPSDDQTAADLRRDGLAEFEAVFDCYKTPVLTALTWCVPGSHEAEALFHSTFVRVGRLLDGPGRPACLASMVVGAVASELQIRSHRDRARWVNREMHRVDEGTTGAGSGSRGHGPRCIGLLSQMREAVLKLAEADRISFVLARVAGLTHSQIAIGLGVSQQIVHQRIVRSLILITSRLPVPVGQPDIER